MEICEKKSCTGCGLCANLCTHQAIKMKAGEHGFIIPSIDETRCISCNLCKTKCPANNMPGLDCNIQNVYAVWNKSQKIRQESTSGGVFSLLAQAILKDGGLVAGVKWTENFQAVHCLIDNIEDLREFYGSKYVQSFTNTIYEQVKEALKNGRKVLFSGTPCQNHALRLFLEKTYDSLFQIDVICHGVPSDEILQKHLDEISKNGNKCISNIRLRHKAPHWDYCNVTVDFSDGSYYTKPTVDDSYFTLFNVGYSLRMSCHQCPYTSLNRQGDITLADFWSFIPHNLKMIDYNRGVSCVLINSEKGRSLFNLISENVVCEERSIDEAKQSNKSLSEPYCLPQEGLCQFWIDYENGMTIDKLCKKYVPNPFIIPKHIWLRRLKRKYRWVLKRK